MFTYFCFKVEKVGNVDDVLTYINERSVPVDEEKVMEPTARNVFTSKFFFPNNALMF